MVQTNEEPTKDELLQKIAKLESKLNAYEKSKEKASKTRLFVAQKLGGFFLLGPKLKQSLRKVLEGDLSKDNLAEVLIAVLYRFTRIGLFAFLVAMVPIGVLTIQTVLLNRQNEKIDKQNNLFEKQNSRLDQQTALLEADRRSAVILESGNVLDAVSRELADPSNKKDSLSNPLIGRIIALSSAMKEYRFLDPDADTLIGKAMSPERGHLLVSLQESNLDSLTYQRINTGANFSKAILHGFRLFSANFKNANLNNADLQFVDLSYANLQGANLEKVNFRGSDLSGANFSASITRWPNATVT